MKSGEVADGVDERSRQVGKNSYQVQTAMVGCCWWWELKKRRQDGRGEDWRYL